MKPGCKIELYNRGKESGEKCCLIKPVGQKEKKTPFDDIKVICISFNKFGMVVPQLISRTAILYWFRYRISLCEKIHGIKIGTSFSNHTFPNIPCSVSTLISPILLLWKCGL